MHTATGEQIFATLESAAVLVLRHLAFGQSLTSAEALVRLDDGRPARVSLLAAASGVSLPSMMELAGRLRQEVPVAQFTDPRTHTQGSWPSPPAGAQRPTLNLAGV